MREQEPKFQQWFPEKLRLATIPILIAVIVCQLLNVWKDVERRIEKKKYPWTRNLRLRGSRLQDP